MVMWPYFGAMIDYKCRRDGTMTDYLNDANQSIVQAQLFKRQIQAKINALLDEFAAGRISREQFHLLYERYSARLEIAEHAIFSGNPDAIAIAQTGPNTLDIRAKTEGKAIGVLVYHHRSRRMLETLGNFTGTLENLTQKLEDISSAISKGRLVEPSLEKHEKDRWLLYTTAAHTTVITRFRNEPSRRQIADIERMHYEFEHANRHLLAAATLDGRHMAYPFIVFVQKQFRK